MGEWRRRNLEKTYYDNNDDYDRKGRDYCGERGDPQDSSDSDGYASDYSVYKNDGLSKTDPTHVPREGSYFEVEIISFPSYRIWYTNILDLDLRKILVTKFWC